MLLTILILLLIACGVIVFRLRKRIIGLKANLAALENERETTYQFLDRVGANITKGADSDQTTEIIVEFAQESAKADAACLFVRDRDSDDFRARVVKGLFPPLHKIGTDKLLAKRKYLAEMVKKAVIPVGEGIIGIVAEKGEAMLIPDARRDSRLKGLDDSGVPVRDIILVPLIVRDRILGVLALVNKKGEEPFDENDMRLVMGIADQAAVTIDMVRLHKIQAEQQRIEQELEVARTFQASLLPREKPSYPHIELADFYKPALEVGGDYYDFIEIDAHHIGVVVGDVSGKGIPGGLVMASVRATLRAEARITLSPKEVLRRVNEQAVRDTRDSVFITMTYGILDTRTGKFRFCRAGHEPILCCNNHGETIRSYAPEGIALGIIAGELFNVTEESEIDLSEEQLIVLYTDGVIEAMNSKAEEYGESRFHDIIRRYSTCPLSSIVDEVVRDIEDFTKGRPQHDDITLVMLGWKSDSGGENQLTEELKSSTA